MKRTHADNYKLTKPRTGEKSARKRITALIVRRYKQAWKRTAKLAEKQRNKLLWLQENGIAYNSGLLERPSFNVKF